MKRDKFKCKLCNDDETTLNVHHIKYDGDPWEIDNLYLVTVCEHCHKEIELLKKEYDTKNIDLNDLKIYKSDNWSSGTIIMYVNYKNQKSFRIYDKNLDCISGFNLSSNECKNIVKFMK